MSRPTGPVRFVHTELTRGGPRAINLGAAAERLQQANQPRPATRKVDINVDVNTVKATGYTKK